MLTQRAPDEDSRVASSCSLSLHNRQRPPGFCKAPQGIWGWISAVCAVLGGKRPNLPFKPNTAGIELLILLPEPGPVLVSGTVSAHSGQETPALSTSLLFPSPIISNPAGSQQIPCYQAQRSRLCTNLHERPVVVVMDQDQHGGLKQQKFTLPKFWRPEV